MNYINKETKETIWACKNTPENQETINQMLTGLGYNVTQSKKTGVIDIWGNGLLRTIFVYQPNYVCIDNQNKISVCEDSIFEEKYIPTITTQKDSPPMEQLTEEEILDIIRNPPPEEEAKDNTLVFEQTIISGKERFMAEEQIAELQTFLLSSEINQSDNALSICVRSDKSLVILYEPKERSWGKLRDLIVGKFVREGEG